MASEKDTLRDINERWQFHQDAWRENWEEGDIDMRYAAGDPWPAYEKAARSQQGKERPMLVFDECGQYIQEAINQARANKRAVKVLPAPNIPGTPPPSDEEAQLRGARIRAIEYKWNAQQAYITALENTIRRGMGYWRIGKKRISPDTFDQEITIRPIPNSRQVSLDPEAKSPVFSDMRDAFIFESMTKKAFLKRWPDAKVTSFDAIEQEITANWITGEMIQVAEYWCIKSKSRKLLMIEALDGSTVTIFQDELKERGMRIDGGTVFLETVDGWAVVGQVARSEKSEYPEVYQYLTNGVELLDDGEPVKWDGKYIPIVPVIGPQYWVRTQDGTTRRVIESLVRKARDPILTLCYIRSTQAEMIGAGAKTPYIGYEGQFTDPNWQYANRTNIVKLEVPAMVDGANGQILPLPQRQPITFASEVAALEVTAEAARRAIQAAMGLNSLPSDAQRRNQKSGVALERIEQKSQQGRFHLVDALEQALVQSGRIISDLLPRIEDTPRYVQTRNDADEAEVIEINENTFSQAEFDVVISTGPAYDTARQQASEFADLLMESQFGPRVADIAVKLKEIDPVIREELAQRLTPPDIAAQKAQGEPDAAAMQAQMQAMGQQMQALNAYAQQIEEENKQLKSGIVAKQIDANARLREAQINAQSREKVAVIQVTGKLKETRMQGVIDAHLQDKESEDAEHDRELARETAMAGDEKGEGSED